MTKQEFIKALQSRNYSDMLSIYMQFKNDQKFDGFFNENKENPTAIQINMLHNKVSSQLRILEQQKYFNNQQETTPEIGVKPTPQKPQANKPGQRSPKSNKKRIIKSETVDYDSLPSDMKALFDENTRFAGEMKSAHALMSAATTNEERALHNAKLKELEDRKYENWLIIDEWMDTHDSSPAGETKETTKQLSAVDLAKKIASAQKYIQRVEGKEKNDEQRDKVAANRKFLEEMGAKANVRHK